MAKTQPNFIFFITDQHRADWLGCSGHPIVKTPNIDLIAANGTRFDNFHVASPVCMPNRASLLTGRYPSQHGLRYNGCALPQNANTFVDVLGASGYKTAAIGKSHIQPFLDTAPIGRNSRKTGPILEAWKEDQKDYSQEEPGKYLSNNRYEFKTPYYGYQHVDMVTSHGDQCGGHYQQWFREHAPNWVELQDRKNQLPHNYSCPQSYRTPIPVELYPTTYIKNQAIEYLKSSVSEDDPFFLFVSFPDPHHPFNPPGKYWDMYSPSDFEPNLSYEDHKNPTPPMQFLYQNWKNGKGQLTPQTATMIEREQIKEAMALTAGMITMVDDAIGEIITALNNSNQTDNTIICFNSDHGDYLGDFNMILKGALPFKSITRVPFIWSDPQQQQQPYSKTLSSTIDLSATILDRAGINPYFGIKGKTLLSSMSKDEKVRNELLIEYNDGGSRLGFEAPARVRSLLTEKFRFTFYLDQNWGELYDLSKDPNETNNLWNTVTYKDIKAELSLSLNQSLTGLMDESPQSKRLA
jgi:arylsulfatase A-like enzyme